MDKENMQRMAAQLNLKLPEYDPMAAILLDIQRLQSIEERWNQACEIAKEHCPVQPGQSAIRHGIPKLAERVALLEDELALAQSMHDVAVKERDLERHLNKKLRDIVHDLAGVFSRLNAAVEVYLNKNKPTFSPTRLLEERAEASKRFITILDKL